MQRWLGRILLLVLVGGIVVWIVAFRHGTADDQKGSTLKIARIEVGDLIVTIGATGTLEPEEVVDVGAQVAGKVQELGVDPNSGKSIDYGAAVEPDTVLARIDPALYEQEVNVARAQLAKTQARLKQTKALTGEATAAVERAVAIRSPIKGVIIDRRVNIGQTVVSSLNAPSLFLIAKDLRRLQVWASVNEADIGRLAAKQPVTFSVDAFPGEIFQGTVQQIRLNASMTQNVVTYTVVVDADNSRNKLLPYLTANVKFEVARLTAVLLVPNTALRWKPRTELIGPEFCDGKMGKSVLWTRRGDFVRPIAATAEDSDGTVTAVVGDELVDGLEIVVGESVREIKSNVVNPLLPQTQAKKKS